MSTAQRLREIRDGFERPFWVANVSELFERLSYYAAFASLARYLHEALGSFAWMLRQAGETAAAGTPDRGGRRLCGAVDRARKREPSRRGRAIILR